MARTIALDKQEELLGRSEAAISKREAACRKAAAANDELSAHLEARRAKLAAREEALSERARCLEQQEASRREFDSFLARTSEELSGRARELDIQEEKVRRESDYADEKLEEYKAIEQAIGSEVGRETLLRHVGVALHDVVSKVVAAHVFWERDEAATLIADVTSVVSAATDAKDLIVKVKAGGSGDAAAAVEKIAATGPSTGAGGTFVGKIKLASTFSDARAALDGAATALRLRLRRRRRGKGRNRSLMFDSQNLENAHLVIRTCRKSEFALDVVASSVLPLSLPGATCDPGALGGGPGRVRPPRGA